MKKPKSNIFSLYMQFFMHYVKGWIPFFGIIAAVSIWIIIPLRCLCRLPCFISCRGLFFSPSSDFLVTVASSHQASQRDYYHTVLFVPRRRRHSNKSRNSLLLHITNFSYLFLHTFWLRTDLILLDSENVDYFSL